MADKVSAITESAMRGELDFSESLAARVKLLSGCPIEVLEKVRKGLVFTPGARELTRVLKRLGFKMAVVSGTCLSCSRALNYRRVYPACSLRAG